MSKPITIFIRCEGRTEPLLQETHEGTTVASLMAVLDQQHPSAGAHLFEEDADEPLRAHHQLMLGDHESKILHRARCRQVHVTVRYAGRTLQEEFGPGSTLSRIERWAERTLGIDPADAAHLSLQIAGSTERPPASTHIGSLVSSSSCAVAFDLLPSDRVNGDG